MHVEGDLGAGWWRVHESAALDAAGGTWLVLHRDRCRAAASTTDLVTTEAALALLASPGTRPCPRCGPDRALCRGAPTDTASTVVRSVAEPAHDPSGP
ncbi:DUF6233 domain-containing protein [Streptomyces zagrosensis]|uniref:Methylphosphotriester-DNA--protein-cysteine methyltransferase n=1 Tax=Streptomyces zagrosensis TaxID=1042984 RepID=A0A7W9QCM1_9ACTN|nr:DUF6233 domain-containing protein [Streptomyces zagrosensis]MBB5937745.1 methylphosphotriester-DNA--protein-cysteine methyltransferase [Streptomyces zagrosensis]